MVRSESLKNELNFLEVIQFSCITSKARYLNEKQGQIVIFVSRDANKIQVKEAVEKTFGIEVSKVRIINVKGKNKISARRYKYASADRKKAIIILKDRNVTSQIADASMQGNVNSNTLNNNQEIILNKNN